VFVQGAKNPRFCDEKTMSAKLGVAPGCVTPLAIMNNADNDVNVIIDKKLMSGDKPVLVHPLNNEATVGLTPDQLTKFVKKYTGDDRFQVLDMTVDEATAAAAAAAASKPKKQKKQKKDQQQKKKKKQTQSDSKEVIIGLTAKKATNFALWYQQLVQRSGLIEYYDVSGCYILRPLSYSVWEKIQRFFDDRIKELGVENAYFPVFVSEAALKREEDHIAGFAPEVAWVTHAGDSELAQKIAIRPTSETIMYPAFSKWIRSHRDLPMKLNQWSNVVRWEFSNPTPFTRTREFLWQEGHTAYETKAEADVEVRQILDLYARVYEELLCVPVTQGKKTEKEKFAGGDYTTTVEAFIPATGRGIQGGTSHGLGQNFSKMFDIRFENAQGDRPFVWQNSWGLTTRTIGVMLMVHGDDKGIVFPPKVAPTQVVIIPIPHKNTDAKEQLDRANTIAADLRSNGIRVKVDNRENYSPGWKYNDWELKGVPVRLELGPRDMKQEEVRMVFRYNGEKQQVSWSELSEVVLKSFEDIHTNMLARARDVKKSRTSITRTWQEFIAALDAQNVCYAPWCGVQACEEIIKDRSGEETADAEEVEDEDVEDDDAAREAAQIKLTGSAKSLCMPFDQPELSDNEVCVQCGEKAVIWCLFGRSY
jgi:prolyl-tRNA synthetase